VPTRVDGKLIEFSQRMTASMNLKEFQGMSARAVLDILAEVGSKAKEYAAENVDADKGPGPHPHRTDYGWVYEDRGIKGGGLGSQLGIRRVPDGIFVHCYVYTPSQAGAYLEIGWTGPSGEIYRYPWLKPAWEKAQKEFAAVARTRLKRTLADSTKGRRAGVIMDERKIAKFIADTEEFNRILAANKGDDEALNATVSEAIESIGSHKEYVKSILTISRKATQALARKKRRVETNKLKKPADKKPQAPAQTTSQKPKEPKNIEDAIQSDIDELRRRIQGNKGGQE
jgi:hypothetical protein